MSSSYRSSIAAGKGDGDNSANFINKIRMIIDKTELSEHSREPQVVAEYTVRALQRTVPAAVPAIVFLSGGQSEEEATLNLNAMNQLNTKKMWTLSFSFGRALQQSTLKKWQGKEDNVEAAQAAFLSRCKANSEATLGAYKGDAALGEGVSESLHVVVDHKDEAELAFQEVLILKCCRSKRLLIFVAD
ncbi:Fructose-bisphosphate aldolase cytoplasmic isozyme [Nymphaea thermarum]|nr:Fructose-bisphosphate aldolase cytoplasmic isozyme [Nymphaea thermarum]